MPQNSVLWRYFTPLAFPWAGRKVPYVHGSVAAASYPAVHCSDRRWRAVRTPVGQEGGMVPTDLAPWPGILDYIYRAQPWTDS